MAAKLGSVSIPCAEVALPLAPVDRFQVLGDEGMADQSTLFEADRWDPFAWPVIITGQTRNGVVSVFNQLRALRRTKVDAIDAEGGTTLKKALVCAVIATTPPNFAGVIIGGSTPTDTWEMGVTIVLLPASE